jgi:hypothetical protein
MLKACYKEKQTNKYKFNSIMISQNKNKKQECNGKCSWIWFDHILNIAYSFQHSKIVENKQNK